MVDFSWKQWLARRTQLDETWPAELDPDYEETPGPPIKGGTAAYPGLVDPRRLDKQPFRRPSDYRSDLSPEEDLSTDDPDMIEPEVDLPMDDPEPWDVPTPGERNVPGEDMLDVGTRTGGYGEPHAKDFIRTNAPRPWKSSRRRQYKPKPVVPLQNFDLPNGPQGSVPELP